MGIRPTPRAPVAEGDISGLLDSADGHADDDSGNMRLPISVVCLTVQMAMRMKSPDELPQIIKMACAYVLPIAEYHYVRDRIESGAIRIPKRTAIYKWCVKLDWISMLYQRVLFSKARAGGKRWYSQFGSDASSQSGFEYFTTIEERTILEGDDDAVAHLASTAGGLNCFTTHRRAMPLQVLGLGAQGVSEKYANLLKCLAQETAAGDLDQRRAWASGTSSRKDKMVDHDRA